MKAKAFLKTVSMIAACVMAVSAFSACSSSSSGSSAATAAGTSAGTEAESTSTENGVLRVGMECAYAPFNWTQVSAEVPNGDTAVEIYGGGGYAYGYDVMVAKKLAEEQGTCYHTS